MIAGHASAPALWSLEIANALEMAVRRSRITAEHRKACAQLLGALPIRLVPLDKLDALGPVADLARRRGLSVYDATYLQLALLQAAPIATRDLALNRAATAEGVPSLF